MFDRSSLGPCLLLLAASCVPPDGRGAAGLPPARSDATRAAADRSALPGGRSWQASALIANGPLVALAAPVVAPPFAVPPQTSDDARRSLECLTAAVYYEARSEPIDGQRAVAQVVLNRVRNPAFPASVCGVVYQGAFRTTGCQFSFTCDGSMLFRREPAAWERAGEVAQAALNGSVDPDVGSATFYHTTAILPWWASSLEHVATIGAHIFYRWPGRLGDALAFQRGYAGVEPDPASATRDRLSDQSVVQYALGDAATVTVHRGAPDADTAPAPRGAGLLVRVHLGGGPASDGAATDLGSAVTIHRGSSPDQVAPG